MKWNEITASCSLEALRYSEIKQLTLKLQQNTLINILYIKHPVHGTFLKALLNIFNFSTQCAHIAYAITKPSENSPPRKLAQSAG